MSGDQLLFKYKRHLNIAKDTYILIKLTTLNVMIVFTKLSVFVKSHIRKFPRVLDRSIRGLHV